MVNISTVVLSSGSKAKGNCLETTLQSILNQDKTPAEIILVDNNNPDEQIEICPSPPIKIIRTGGVPRGVARNYGAKASTGSIIVFIDDDTFISTRDAFSRIDSFRLQYDYGYGAKRRWISDIEEFSKYKEEIERRFKLTNWTDLLEEVIEDLPITFREDMTDLSRFSFPGNFGFVRKDLFQEVGGFSPEFKGYGYEDDFLAYELFRARPRGFKFLFEDVGVVHINHPVTDGHRGYGEGENYKTYQKLLKVGGTMAFNINVLFGVPEYTGQQIMEINEKS